MKFYIYSTHNYLPKLVLKNYPCLIEFNYELGPIPEEPYRYRDATVEINTLEDLITLMNATGEPLIISPKSYRCDNEDYEIEIYDSYRE